MSSSSIIQLDSRGKQAITLIQQGENLFITGKAGTGKTTLLRELLNRLERTVAVVAPTGVAAKNATGITIHTFLRLPVTPYFPGIKNTELYKLKRSEEEVIKKVEVIIIDEVSMVRCDVLDAMDDVLQHYRKNKKPFGGVQMVMFGDLFQLMPVAPEEEWEKLKKYYHSPYFFCSKAFQQLNCKMLELKKVYRQSESDFITILNNIREGVATRREIDLLNTRYDEKANSKDKDHILLTTHNRRARGFNWGRLQELKGEMQEYKATITGWFPSEEYPTSYVLKLKVGAKVMFVRNDTNEQRYYNGLMGVVTELGYGYIEVETNERKIFVKPQRWEHQRYYINKETKKLEVEVTGAFVQFPLMLAWAVTIHKSQGLTFDKVMIDAARAFTFGQVYVALSRCRTLGGIILTSPVTEKGIKVDEVVKNFMKETPRVFSGDDVGEERKHISFENPEDKTLFLIKSGLSVGEIVKKSETPRPIVLSHITKLVAKGKVEGADFVSLDTFNAINLLFQKHGIQADRKLIRKLAPQAEFGEIEIVRAQLSRVRSMKKETKEKIKEKEEVKKRPVKKKKSRLNATLNATLKLYREGLCIEDIAIFRKMAVSTIYTHMNQLIGIGEANVFDFVSKQDVILVTEAIKAVGLEKLSLIKEQLPEGISYETIKMVVAYERSHIFKA